MTVKFNNDKISSKEGFWTMFYFLKEHFDLTSGEITVGELLSLCEPIADNEPADISMIDYWNEALEKYKNEDKPEIKKLKK